MCAAGSPMANQMHSPSRASPGPGPFVPGQVPPSCPSNPLPSHTTLCDKTERGGSNRTSQPGTPQSSPWSWPGLSGTMPQCSMWTQLPHTNHVGAQSPTHSAHAAQNTTTPAQSMSAQNAQNAQNIQSQSGSLPAGAAALARKRSATQPNSRDPSEFT